MSTVTVPIGKFLRVKVDFKNLDIRISCNSITFRAYQAAKGGGPMNLMNVVYKLSWFEEFIQDVYSIQPNGPAITFYIGVQMYSVAALEGHGGITEYQMRKGATKKSNPWSYSSFEDMLMAIYDMAMNRFMRSSEAMSFKHTRKFSDIHIRFAIAGGEYLAFVEDSNNDRVAFIQCSSHEDMLYQGLRLVEVYSEIADSYDWRRTEGEGFHYSRSAFDGFDVLFDIGDEAGSSVLTVERTDEFEGIDDYTAQGKTPSATVALAAGGFLGWTEFRGANLAS